MGNISKVTGAVALEAVAAVCPLTDDGLLEEANAIARERALASAEKQGMEQQKKAHALYIDARIAEIDRDQKKRDARLHEIAAQLGAFKTPWVTVSRVKRPAKIEIKDYGALPEQFVRREPNRALIREHALTHGEIIDGVEVIDMGEGWRIR